VCFENSCAVARCRSPGCDGWSEVERDLPCVKLCASHCCECDVLCGVHPVPWLVCAAPACPWSAPEATDRCRGAWRCAPDASAGARVDCSRSGLQTCVAVHCHHQWRVSDVSRASILSQLQWVSAGCEGRGVYVPPLYHSLVAPDCVPVSPPTPYWCARRWLVEPRPDCCGRGSPVLWRLRWTTSPPRCPCRTRTPRRASWW
jgi:hypothetical protein